MKMTYLFKCKPWCYINQFTEDDLCSDLSAFEGLLWALNSKRECSINIFFGEYNFIFYLDQICMNIKYIYEMIDNIKNNKSATLEFFEQGVDFIVEHTPIDELVIIKYTKGEHHPITDLTHNFRITINKNDYVSMWKTLILSIINEIKENNIQWNDFEKILKSESNKINKF